MTVFWTLVGCAGLVFVLRYGTILARARERMKARSSTLRELFDCSLCLGFWVGVLAMAAEWQRGTDIDPWWPFRAAAFCYVADLVVDVLDLAKHRLGS